MPTIAIEQTGGRFVHPLVYRIASAGGGRAPPARAGAAQSGAQIGAQSLYFHWLAVRSAGRMLQIR